MAGNRWLSILAINVASIWSNVGYATIISLAGMQSVSKDYIEAAKIDGANEWKTYTRITLPLIMPIVNVNILTNIIYGLKMLRHDRRRPRHLHGELRHAHHERNGRRALCLVSCDQSDLYGAPCRCFCSL